MSNAECQHVSENFAEIARALYARSGAIMPVVQTAGCKRPMSALPPEGVDLRLTVPRLARVLTWASRSSYVTLIGEAWARDLLLDDPEPEHGELAVMAETDPDVHTAILVTTWEVRNARRGAVIKSIPVLAADGSLTWEIDTRLGAPQGAMADAVRAALETIVPLPPPRTSDLHVIADLIVDEGGAVEVYVDA